MESASHASVWDVGYFPPCAVAATCGIGVPARAASCVSMSVPRTPSTTMVQDVQGFVAKAIGEGEAATPRNTLARVSNNCFGVSMPGTLKSRSQASQPVGNLLLSDNVRGWSIT